MAINIEDDKIITALKHTLQHISLQQTKFKDIDVELQQTKKELAECAQLKTRMQELRTELNHFKSLSEEQSINLSELEIKCVTETQRNTALSHELQKKEIMIEEIKVANERNACNLVNELENDNKMLEKHVSTLQTKLDCNSNEMKRAQNENKELQNKISTMLDKERTILQQTQDNETITIRVKELEDKNKVLSQKCEALIHSENDKTIKYEKYSERMLKMGKCSFRMRESCRNLRQCMTNTTSDIAQHQQNIEAELQQELKKISTLSIQSQNNCKPSHEIKEAIKSKFNAVKDTKVVMNELRKDIKKELKDFDSNMKQVQRVIFKKRSKVHDEIRKEKDKTVKLTECLIENEQNMEQELKDYLQQKEELQNKINKLEGFLTDKQEKDIVAQMKRFRSAAIVTSITSLSDDGNKAISYHKLSEHERNAISLKSKIEKRFSPEIDIHEKVDEFIRSGGLKRYPIMAQEFNYEPNDLDNNRFRFGSKYISISYNIKRNELYVKNEDNSSQLLQKWIAKNGSNEMRKFLAKVSKKKKTNKQLLQPKKPMFP